MADHSEKSWSSVSEGPASPEVIPLKDKAMVAHTTLVSVLDESTGLLKLYFGLQTGAVVLFVKVLTDVRSPTPVRVALAISIFLFGASALTCLNLLGGLVEVRAKMVRALVDEKKTWSEVFDVQIKEWQTKMAKTGRVMEWLFRLALLFAGIFVVGILVTN